ncbi:ABC transporter permease [Mycobacterium sp. SMC-4]|uniref:ABC transporter permease n=1 Tax=Mycobacterium sp. SMC-4 TaxID=2857059 RepID=UPI003CFCD371
MNMRPVKSVLTPERTGRLAAWTLGIIAWQVIAWRYPRVPSMADTVTFMSVEARSGALLDNLIPTLGRLAAGQGAAIVVGITLGILIGSIPVFRSLFGDLVTVALALPAFVWALLGALWFGFGWRGPVLAVFLSALPFIAVNVANGAAGISAPLRQMTSSFGVSRTRSLRDLVIPAVTPNIVAGIRLSTVIAWNAVLISEWFSSRIGVGHRARYWYDANNFDGFIAWAVLFIALILIVDRVVLERLSRRAFQWRPQDAQETSDRTVVAV